MGDFSPLAGAILARFGRTRTLSGWGTAPLGHQYEKSSSFVLPRNTQYTVAV